MKRLIVCCDGTWNRADQVVDGVHSPTNVVRLRDALADTDGEGNLQRAEYIRGVGTDRWERIRGGGFGFGLSRNVRDAYRFLVRHYEPGDLIYLFGFSRGAFTARSTAGLIRNCGILRPEHAGRVDQAYRFYRDDDLEKEPDKPASVKFRSDHSHPDLRIKCIAVWDTVGALGIPIDGVRLPIISKRWTFHDTTLSSRVDNAFHAVSIDERRGPFKPTLWVEDESDKAKASTAEQTVEQLWFAGVHSDVGGGYPDTSLADIPLGWMIKKAKACGLVFDPIDTAPNLHGELHKSRKGMYRFLPTHDRWLKPHRGTAVSAALARSAKTRHLETPEEYKPPGLEEWIAAGRPVTDVPDGT